MEASGRHILIVEDDADIYEAMRIVLEAKGFSVSRARNTEETGLRLREQRPDLIVLDVILDTETEGFQIAYQLRTKGKKFYEYKDVPILMMTAIGQLKGMHFSPEKDGDYLPVDRYLEKPVSPSRLVAEIEMLLATSKS
jgi:DNA-binding response OmpR family regulator